MASTHPHDVTLIDGGERAVWQAHGKDLVGSDGGLLAIGPVDHVVQTLAVCANEAHKASFGGVRRSAEVIRLSQNCCERAHYA